MIAIHEVLRVDVFVNEDGRVVIEQQDGSHEGPSIIDIHPDHVGALCKSLLKTAKEARVE